MRAPFKRMVLDRDVVLYPMKRTQGSGLDSLRWCKASWTTSQRRRWWSSSSTPRRVPPLCSHPPTCSHPRLELPPGAPHRSKPNHPSRLPLRGYHLEGHSSQAAHTLPGNAATASEGGAARDTTLQIHPNLQLSLRRPNTVLEQKGELPGALIGVCTRRMNRGRNVRPAISGRSTNYCGSPGLRYQV